MTQAAIPAAETAQITEAVLTALQQAGVVPGPAVAMAPADLQYLGDGWYASQSNQTRYRKDGRGGISEAGKVQAI